MKRHSLSLTIGKTQIKTMMRYYPMSARMLTGKKKKQQPNGPHCLQTETAPAFPCTLAGTWIRSRMTETWTGSPRRDADVTSSGLTHCITTTVLVSQDRNSLGNWEHNSRTVLSYYTVNLKIFTMINHIICILLKIIISESEFCIFPF